MNRNITDLGLKYIPNIHTLILNYNTNITNQELKYISYIDTLNLFSNKNIFLIYIH